MRRLLVVLAISSTTLAGGLLAAGTTRAASGEKTFLLPANEGYGVADCLVGATECGQVVADAWCEAQGFSVSTSYGVAAREDLTGAIGPIDASPGARAPEPPIRITCRD